MRGGAYNESSLNKLNDHTLRLDFLGQRFCPSGQSGLCSRVARKERGGDTSRERTDGNDEGFGSALLLGAGDHGWKDGAGDEVGPGDVL